MKFLIEVICPHCEHTIRIDNHSLLSSSFFDIIKESTVKSKEKTPFFEDDAKESTPKTSEMIRSYFSNLNWKAMYQTDANELKRLKKEVNALKLRISPESSKELEKEKKKAISFINKKIKQVKKNAKKR